MKRALQSMVVAALVGWCSSVACADYYTVVFDWGTTELANAFNGRQEASVTVDHVTLTVKLLGTTNPYQYFTVSDPDEGTQGLGANPVGAAANFDGESYQFSFNTPGKLTGITFARNYQGQAYLNLATPHDGTHQHANVSGTSYTFAPGELFTVTHGAGSYRLGTLTVYVPEPASLAVLALGALGVLRRRRQV